MSKSKTSKKHKITDSEFIDLKVDQKIKQSLDQLKSECFTVIEFLIGLKSDNPFYRNFNHYTDIFLKWLEYLIIKQEIDDYVGRNYKQINLEKLDNDAMKKLTPSEFWNSINFFKSIGTLRWDMSFTEESRQKLMYFNPSLREAVLKKLILHATGYINPGINCEVIHEGPCANMIFLSSSINKDLSLLFAILMTRVPQLNYYKRPSGFKFYHMIKVIDIVNKKETKRPIESFLEKIKDDPDKWIQPVINPNGMFVFFSFENSVQRMDKFLCLPKMFPFLYIDEKTSEKFRFDEEKQRWVNDELVEENYWKTDPYYQSIIKLLETSRSGQMLVNFIRKIPGFSVRLTEEQEELVLRTDNVLAIGRSGTGKTTCSVLKLLASEMLYRFTARDNSEKFTSEEIEKEIELHTVFITASPVLTNEVKNFYSKISGQIKEKLKIKEKSETVKKEENFKSENLPGKRGEQLKGHESNTGKDEGLKEMDSYDIITEELLKSNEESKIENKDTEMIEKKELNIEDLEIDENEEIIGPCSLKLMKNEDFPIFVTVRKMIFMIDGSLKEPFFLRNKEGNIIGSSSNFQWHNEFKGMLMINKEFKSSKQPIPESREESDSDQETQEKKPKKSSILKRKNRQSYRKLSYEVDFTTFSTKFFPRIKGSRFSPLVLWTEISAYIKGSAQSFKFSNCYLPKEVYLSLGRKVSLLSKEDKGKIWDIFIEYERWKDKEDAYDMQDVVNYLLNKIAFYGYKGIPIHFMMIDEVQDLTSASLYLLMLITQNKLFFSGDTAQTIAKGVGFRFCDLKGIFVESKVTPPTVCQLTMNFRTHNQMLGLANSIVALLETLFPSTIDKMAKEVSSKNGPMPTVLESNDTQDLFFLAFGISALKDPEPDTEFGCNQVIIVRSQESKKHLPLMLKHALCLTVYEAKGLEFDDVILYNFFAESEAPLSIWNLLINIRKKDSETENKPTNFEELEEGVQKLASTVKQNDPEISILCTELKHLYVAVTRAKKRLVIFDENSESRSTIESFWKMMDVISFGKVQKTDSGEIISDAFGEKLAKKTSKEEWRAQGLKMFSNKYYEQAHKCFEISGDKDLSKRSESFSLAGQAASIIQEIDALLSELQYENKKPTKQMKTEIKLKKNEARSLFIKAGETFLEVSENAADKEKVLKNAAKCFSSGNDFKSAADIYKSISLFGQAGESELASGNFESAGDLFLTINEYTRAIEAYKLALNWDKLVKTIYSFKEIMGAEEKQAYIQKYIPAALEELAPRLLDEGQADTEYINQIKSETKRVIKEESDEESSNEKESHSLKEKSETFALLSQENSFSLLSDKIEIDTGDEWLLIDKKSVLEKLDSVINPDGSITSDFSVLDSSFQGRGKVIKTRGDIFVEDVTMRKIIEYVSMFSDEVSGYLKGLRSQESLVSSKVFKEDWELVSLIDLDEMSPELVGLLLDMLEEFRMFKLCLIVSNRYNLVDRAGRYIVSIAFKYSNLDMDGFKRVKGSDKEIVQRAAIAFTAIHNVFEAINPSYLAGLEALEAFRGLVLLGYWKKVIYLLDKENALAVAWCFGDLAAYKTILKQGVDEGVGWVDENMDLQHLVAGMDVIKTSVCLTPVPLFYKNTLRSKELHKEDNSAEFIMSLSDNITSYFSVKDTNLKDIDILDCISSWSVILADLIKMKNSDLIENLDIYQFEKFLLTTCCLFRFLTCPRSCKKNGFYIRHCILSSVSVRSIPLSKITLEFPRYSHSVISSDSLLINKLHNKLYPFDLEYKNFLVSNDDVTSIYIDTVLSAIKIIIEKRKSEGSAQSFLNALGENWLCSFMSTPNSYNFRTYDSLYKSYKNLCSEYSLFEKKLNESKDAHDEDEIYAEYDLKTRNKEFKFLQKKMNSIQAEIEKSRLSEIFVQVSQFTSKSRFLKSSDLLFTKTAKQAFLTYSQFLMNLTETEGEQSRNTRLWTSFELCRVSDQMIFFIEMLRCRNRLVIKDGRKKSKVSGFYYDAVGLADLHVYDRLGCYDSCVDTILNLLDTFDFEDREKIFYLQKLVVSWLFSYKKVCSLPKSLQMFWVGKVRSTKNSGKIRVKVLEKVCQLFLHYSAASLPDNTKEEYIGLILDCLATVIFYIEKDKDASECKNKMTRQPDYLIGKSLKPFHVCFKLLEDYPNFKSNFEGFEVKVDHIDYPDEELEHEWMSENKAIACRQRFANLIKRLRKNNKLKLKKSNLNSSFELVLGRPCATNRVDKCIDHLSEIYYCFYRMDLLSSLDLHFLLDKATLVSRYIEGNCEGDLNINEEIKQLESWKSYSKPVNKRKKSYHKTWNFKWGK